MECNREEALRAKEIAEEKLGNNDYGGAMTFARIALTLYPGLEGMSQMLAVLNVHASAERKFISGETDWYGVLGVSPSVDEETIKKHYRKLALLVHPDKNKSAGADNAFKLISEAWTLLSDKEKRLAYDERIRVWTEFLQTRVPKPTPAVSTSSSGRTPRSFWTMCHHCKMCYEYHYMYLEHTLECPYCFKPFKAVQTPAPPLKRRRFNAQNNVANVTAAQGNAHAQSNVANVTAAQGNAQGI